MSEYLINASWELIFLKIALYSGHVFFSLYQFWTAPDRGSEGPSGYILFLPQVFWVILSRYVAFFIPQILSKKSQTFFSSTI